MTKKVQISTKMIPKPPKPPKLPRPPDSSFWNFMAVWNRHKNRQPPAFEYGTATLALLKTGSLPIYPIFFCEPVV